jgi:hypothetical protein
VLRAATPVDATAEATRCCRRPRRGFGTYDMAATWLFAKAVDRMTLRRRASIITSLWPEASRNHLGHRLQ